MRAALVTAAALMLALIASPARADTDLEVSFGATSEQNVAATDSSIVVAGEPTRACAAPAFARPIDHVAAPPLAATGIGPALQIVALGALAMAGLMAPRRHAGRTSSWLSPHGHEDPQG
ncbi:MAG: hypothetical protein R3249_03500 [Nitriliruptorales bacterium]|nr:hypothetical protein [Nitriliruptorales bacterium]